MRRSNKVDALRALLEIKVPSAVAYSILAVGSFAWISAGVHPALVFAAQEPPFRFDPAFLARFLNVPGGLLDLAGALITQFFAFPLLGAAAVSLLILWALALGRAFAKSADMRLPGIELLPAVLLLAMLGCYDHPLQSTLGILVSATAGLLFIRASIRNAGVRIAAFAAPSVLLHSLAGGHLFLFALIVLLRDVRAGNFVTSKGLRKALELMPFTAARYCPSTSRQEGPQQLSLFRDSITRP